MPIIYIKVLKQCCKKYFFKELNENRLLQCRKVSILDGAVVVHTDGILIPLSKSLCLASSMETQ